METPRPVDINSISDVLAKAKMVMNKVDIKPQSKHNSINIDTINENYVDNSLLYNPNDEKELPINQYIPSKSNLTAIDYTDEQVVNSNLPPAIKEAMLKSHIPKINPLASPGLTQETINKVNGVKKNIVSENVSNNSDLITINKNELNGLINEAITKFFVESYNKTISEQAIKKTIGVLLKEGRLKK